MTHGSLFSGIGGFDLASEWMGWQNIFQVEIEEYCQRLLAQNFPNVERHRDIREFDGKQYAGRIDIISGGFPCQPFSQAGKRQGKKDPRHLWPQMLRVISEIEPRWVLGENVSGIFSWSGGLVFDEIQSDLEDIGYETIPVRIPAVAVGAPHRRDRWWFIAHTNGPRLIHGKSEILTTEARFNAQRELIECDSNASDTNGERGNARGIGGREISLHRQNGKTKTSSSGWEKRIYGNRENDANVADAGRKLYEGSEKQSNSNKEIKNGYANIIERPISTSSDIWGWDGGWYEVATEFCTVDDGLPVELDGFTLSKSKHREHQLKGLGNAIVPQVAYEIFKAIEETDKHEV